ncbi:MAG: hypothetical protein IJD24_00665 [Agathobacter sp.]|nr:hypothetical protein [Agathobacter sp.]MBQ6812636.1 hypothetical protein [Agathobacter sp.]
MFLGFEDSLRELKKELKAAGADMSFVKEWQKSYDKVRKQSSVLKTQYTQAKSDLESVYQNLKVMERKLIAGDLNLSNETKSLKQYKTSFSHEFLIGKEDREFHLTFQTILSLFEKKLSSQKDVLILQSEVENLLAVTQEALEREWPAFRAMAYFYIERTDRDIIDMPHTEKIAYVQHIYEDEFVKPMMQVLQTAVGEERAKKVMEVELWI